MAKRKQTAENKKPSDGIDVINVGPVEKIHIAIPENGGICVLRGLNGSGKTQTLNAVNGLMKGSGKDISVKDGEKAAVVDGFGASIKLERATHKGGELCAVSLEGKFSVGDLVDPGFKEPETRDAARIKALVNLANVQATAADFKELFDDEEQFAEIIGKSIDEIPNMVDAAAKVKRECESSARKLESEAEKKETKGQGLLDAYEEQAEDLPEDDLEATQAALRLAFQETTRIKTRLESVEDESQKRKDASAQIEKLRASASSVDDRKAELDDCVTAEKACQNSADNAAKNVTKLEAELAKAKQRATETANALARAKEETERAERELTAANESAEQLEKLETMLSAEPEESEAALRKKLEASETEENRLASLVADIKSADTIRAKIAEGNTLKAEADELYKQGEQLRDIGKATDTILSEAVSKITTADLRIEAGRLVTATDRADNEFFDELSHGERWDLAIAAAVDIVIKAAENTGGNPLIIAPQEAWESLDPPNRKKVNERLQGSGVVMLTAEAADCELSSEIYE